MAEAQKQIDDGVGLQSHQVEQGRGLLRRARKSRSETIGELASKIGVEDAARLESTLTGYNESASKWPPRDDVFAKSVKWVRPLRAPLYAVDCSLYVVALCSCCGALQLTPHATFLPLYNFFVASTGPQT